MTLQPTAALPVDAELWWTGHLRTVLAARSEPYVQSVWLDRRVPSPRRDRMVIVRRDGGATAGLFDLPRISLDVWAMTENDAADLARMVVALATAAPLSAPEVVRVTHLSGPNAVADPSGQPRRQALIEAKHRATLLD